MGVVADLGTDYDPFGIAIAPHPAPGCFGGDARPIKYEFAARTGTRTARVGAHIG